MRTFAAILRWEVKLQARSLRSRVAVAGYVGLCALPPATILYLDRHQPFGPASYLYHLSLVQPFLSLVLVALLAGYRSSIEAQPRMVSVLVSAPLSDAGYLLRRSAAVTLLAVVVSAVPLAVAAGLAVAGSGTWPAVDAWLWTWLLGVVPVVVMTSALWLGTVTIFGSELAALGMVTVGNGLVLEGLNEVLLKRFQVRVEGAFDWSGFEEFGYWTAIWQYLIRPERLEFLPSLAATEAPYDPLAALAQQLPRLAFGFGLAALALGLGVAYVRRTRRDQKPRPVRDDHPVRSLLLHFNQLRQRLAPAGGLAPGDRLAMAAGVLALLGVLTAVVVGHERSLGLAKERYAAETEDSIPPTAADVFPEAWRIRGSVTLDGRVETEVEARVRNRGSEPRERLAFVLDEQLAILEAEAVGRRFESRRHWDRLELRLEAPLAPGDTLELRWRLRGVPGDVYFPLWGRSSYSFASSMKRFLEARFARDLSDLSRSTLQRAASRQRVELLAAHLAPVLRHTPFTLTPFKSITGEGREVPVERFYREADLEVDLVVPRRWFLADVCGQTSRVEGTTSRLRGRCRTALARYGVFGGELVPLRNGRVVVAVLDAHRDAAEPLGDALAEATRLSDRAWPGLKGLESLVVLEELPSFKDGRGIRGFYRSDSPSFELRERLLVISELAFTTNRMPQPSKLVASVLGRDLMASRRFADRHRHLYERFFAALMLRRMGLSKKDARISGPPWLRNSLKKPILEAMDVPWSDPLNHRLPAVVADLEARVGAPRLFAALDAFLAVPDEKGVLFGELFTFLEAETGVGLGRFFDDFVAGGAIPVLVLAEARAERRGDRFEVRGRLRNDGTGEVICPIFVKAEVGTARTLVTVGSESEASFTLLTARRPHTVILDPEGTCHRLVGKTSAAAERVDLLE